MLSCRVLIAIFCALCVPCSAEDAHGPSGLIFTPGTYHGEEFPLDEGKECLALFERSGGFELRSVSLLVETVVDGIVDEEGEATGKQAGVPGSETPLFLFADVDALTIGPVAGATKGGELLYPGKSLFLQESGGAVELRALGAAEEAHSIVLLRDYRLSLQRRDASATQKQELFRAEELYLEGHPPSFLWYGDLDGDEKLDLIMNLTDHYNVRVLTLFLSTKAKEGELVGVAARHVATGC